MLGHEHLETKGMEVVMAEGVYKIVEVVGVSETSWEDAGRNAVETAAVRYAIFGWRK